MPKESIFRWPSGRTIFRTIHLILAIPIIGYVYSPFELIPSYAFPTRFIFFPMMVLTGLWMWKGRAVTLWVTAKR